MNLIVTCPRHFESETKEEVRKILGELGDELPAIFKSDFSGILYVDTNLDPLTIVNEIRKKIIDEPWEIRYSLRWIPIEFETITKLSEITKQVIARKGVIDNNETFRITIEKRNSNISSEEIIKSIASKFPNKVSLDQPDWIILIEILGNKTGISIIKPENILSVAKEKRLISE